MVFKFILAIDGWDISHEMSFRWMSLDLNDDKSTLVQVMAWCRQATSHYLGQCWPRSLPPYGVTRPQWVKKCKLQTHVMEKNHEHFLWICSPINARENLSWEVNDDSGNGLMPLNNNPFSEPIMTQIYVAKWHHYTLMGQGVNSET